MPRNILVISILQFLLPSLFVTCDIWEPSNGGKETVCRSEECLERGELYFNNLNVTENPCDDFYSFVCGAWYVQHKPPQHVGHWTVHNVIEQQLRQNLREILEKPVSKPSPELLQAQYFYDICKKQPFYGRQSPEKIAKQIIKIGRFGKKHVWDIHQAYLKLTGESAFFDHSLYALHLTKLVPLLVIKEVTSPYGAILHGAWKSEEEKNYEDFLYLLMTSLKIPGTDLGLREKIKAVIKFRHQLNEIVLQSQKKSFVRTKLMSAREFQQWFKGLTAMGVKRFEMPWKKIIKTILSVAPNVNQDMQITRMHKEEYFTELDRLLSSTAAEVLVDHMEMYFAERHTVFTEVMEDIVERTATEPTDLKDFIREDTPRWEACLKDHNMMPLIGKILQEKWFKKNITQPMVKLVSDVKLAIASQVKYSSWLNHKTKILTTNRILRVKPWIGYPPWYNDPSTDTRFESAANDPARSEAYIDFDKHVMLIKSPLLQPPFFDPSLPNIYNYAAIGQIVGHELYHVINECGKFVNGNNFPVRWWPDVMRHRCQTQMKCFRDAYNTETQREYELKYHKTKNVTNSQSYLEDFPDVMGLDAAFRAYQTMQKKDKSTCQTLPRFEKYSCEQMFFIAFANNMCGKMTEVAVKYHIDNYRHSLLSVRVNGAVQNSQLFQKAFQCPRGKPMNPPVKCNLWN